MFNNYDVKMKTMVTWRTNPSAPLWLMVSAKVSAGLRLVSFGLQSSLLVSSCGGLNADCRFISGNSESVVFLGIFTVT